MHPPLKHSQYIYIYIIEQCAGECNCANPSMLENVPVDCLEIGEIMSLWQFDEECNVFTFAKF